MWTIIAFVKHVYILFYSIVENMVQAAAYEKR